MTWSHNAADAACLPALPGAAVQGAAPHRQDLYWQLPEGRRDVPVVFGAHLHMVQLPGFFHLNYIFEVFCWLLMSHFRIELKHLKVTEHFDIHNIPSQVESFNIKCV